MQSNETKEFKNALGFSNYVVNEIHFVLNDNFKKPEQPIPLLFDMNKKIVFDENNNSATLTLFVTVFENAKENNFPFQFDLTLTGFFQVENLQNQVERNMIETNAIAILFPYIRALISSYTANANIKPLILPPVNIVKYMKDKSKDETE
jgi:preprotein translocase subunit SecB